MKGSKEVIDLLNEVLTGELKTWVGPGHWFEQDDRYMRVGFGWAASAELERGLQNVNTALARSV